MVRLKLFKSPLDDASFEADFDALGRGERHAVSEKRAAAMQNLTELVKSLENGRVTFKANDELIHQIEIALIPLPVDEDWYSVDRWLLGKIETAGGSAKPSLRVRLADGRKLQIAASAELQGSQSKNFLYREKLLHVQAEENFRTGELRSVRLIDFADYEPALSSAAMASFVAEGTRVWSEVADADQWLADLHGQ